MAINFFLFFKTLSFFFLFFFDIYIHTFSELNQNPISFLFPLYFLLCLCTKTFTIYIHIYISYIYRSPQKNKIKLPPTQNLIDHLKNMSNNNFKNPNRLLHPLFWDYLFLPFSEAENVKVIIIISPTTFFFFSRLPRRSYRWNL